MKNKTCACCNKDCHSDAITLRKRVEELESIINSKQEPNEERCCLTCRFYELKKMTCGWVPDFDFPEWLFEKPKLMSPSSGETCMSYEHTGNCPKCGTQFLRHGFRYCAPFCPNDKCEYGST